MKSENRGPLYIEDDIENNEAKVQTRNLLFASNDKQNLPINLTNTGKNKTSNERIRSIPAVNGPLDMTIKREPKGNAKVVEYPKIIGHVTLCPEFAIGWPDINSCSAQRSSLALNQQMECMQKQQTRIEQILIDLRKRQVQSYKEIENMFKELKSDMQNFNKSIDARVKRVLTARRKRFRSRKRSSAVKVKN